MSVALITARSRSDVATTVQLLQEALHRRGITVFATIDHAAGARSAGLELPDEVVLVFGNPAAGTPVMQADPRAGIDLPLRLLVWSEDGGTRVAFRDPLSLAEDFSLAAQTQTLQKLRSVLDALVAEVAG
ncbi:DUF302 domain-containing protein [Paractinoplanes maris]|uniref:DUF302 domain-containing protein n=1 Tax=Paractinoplanes maris TaxID=1734446 RepID=UPI0020219385|nr:DUF302 domain-containing protein [Actinoplanes maris]